jgi:hypothetical protein
VSAQRENPAAPEEKDYRHTDRWAVAGIGRSVPAGIGIDFIPDSQGMTKAGAPTPAFLPTYRL